MMGQSPQKEHSMKKPSSIGISLFFICLIAVGMLLLGACSGDGENATISIKIGNEPGKAAIGLDQLKHTITLSGPTGTKTLSIKGAGTAKATVVPGFWDISVTAYFGDELYAVGSSSAEVKAGRNTDVQIQMTVVWTDTAGTPSSPAQTFIEIWTIDDLMKVSSGMGKNYKLMADIVHIAAGPVPNGVVLENPLGSNTNPFTGTFDGNGFTIQLNMGTLLPESAGLFAAIGSTGKVMNLKLQGAISETAPGSNVYFVGAVAGESYGTVEGVETSVYINIENAINNVHAGGITGKNYGKIIDCSNSGDITVDINGGSSLPGTVYNAGGIAGTSELAGTITGCKNYSSIHAFNDETAHAGGIAGELFGSNALIKNCSNISLTTIYVNAQSESADAYAGGIAGHLTGDGTIQNCSNKMGIIAHAGSASGLTSYAGGIIGKVDGGEVKNCYNNSDIRVENDVIPYFSSAGGIVGFGNNAFIYYCWAECYVISLHMFAGTLNLGGIVGEIDGTSQIENCVALNGGLQYSGATPNIGRIWGDGTPALAVNNWGNINMNPNPTTWPNQGPTNQDGNGLNLTGGMGTAEQIDIWRDGTGFAWTFLATATESDPWVWSDTTPPTGLPATRPVLYFEL